MTTIQINQKQANKNETQSNI